MPKNTEPTKPTKAAVLAGTVTRAVKAVAHAATAEKPQPIEKPVAVDPLREECLARGIDPNLEDAPATLAEIKEAESRATALGCNEATAHAAQEELKAKAGEHGWQPEKSAEHAIATACNR